MCHCSRPALERQGSMAQHVQADDTVRFLLTRPEWRGFGKARPCLPGPGWAFYFWLDESIIIGRDFEGYPLTQARIAVNAPINDDISLVVIPAKAGIHAYRDARLHRCRR